jgi:hypothetical protein
MGAVCFLEEAVLGQPRLVQAGEGVLVRVLERHDRDRGADRPLRDGRDARIADLDERDRVDPAGHRARPDGQALGQGLAAGPVRVDGQGDVRHVGRLRPEMHLQRAVVEPPVQRRDPLGALLRHVEHASAGAVRLAARHRLADDERDRPAGRGHSGAAAGDLFGLQVDREDQRQVGGDAPRLRIERGADGFDGAGVRDVETGIGDDGDHVGPALLVRGSNMGATVYREPARRERPGRLRGACPFRRRCG